MRTHLTELLFHLVLLRTFNAPIYVKSEEGGGADVGHLIFWDNFFIKNFPPLGTKIWVKINQISPPKISAHLFFIFCKLSCYLQYVRYSILQNI